MRTMSNFKNFSNELSSAFGKLAFYRVHFEFKLLPSNYQLRGVTGDVKGCSIW